MCSQKSILHSKDPVQSKCNALMFLASLIVTLASSSSFAQDDNALPAIPDYFQESGLSRTKGYENQGVNEVIDTFGGKLQYHFTDLIIPGNGGMDLAVQRVYNSIDDPLATTSPWPQEFSPAGLGWTMHFGRIIRGANQSICSNNWASSGKNPVLERPDGQRQVLFEYDQSVPVMWITKDFWRATCDLSSGALGFNVESPDGTRYEMTTPGHSFGPPGSRLKTYYTTRIVDRNGNTANFSYTTFNGSWVVSGITTSDGRAVTFTYNSLGIESITDGTRTWNYTLASCVGGHNCLTQVTRPDGLTWKFAYRSASPGTGSMSQVEYPSGGTIDYTYDHVNFRLGALNSTSSTVVKTKVATPGFGSTDPIGNWTYSYAPSTQALPFTDNGDGTRTFYYNVPNVGTASNGGTLLPSQMNITTVEGPEIGRVVQHYHIGPKSLGDGGRATGRYAGQTSAEEHIVYAYADVYISGQQDPTGTLWGSFEPDTYAGVKQYEARARGEVSPGGGYYQLNETAKSGFDQWGNPSLIQEYGFGGYTGNFARTTSLTYDINTSKWLIRQVSGQTVTIDGQSHSTTRTFDTSGNVLSETVAGVPTTFTYSPSGDMLTRQDALGRITTYGSYKRGIAQTETQPGSVVLTRVVDDAGNVTSATNGRGFATTYTYDGLNRVTGVTPPEGNPVTVAYGARSRTVTRGAMTSQQSFDGLGRLVRQEASAPSEASIAVAYRYDARGRRVFQSYPNSSSGLTYSYDDLDRVIEVAHPSLDGLTYSEYIGYIGMRTFHRDSTGRGRILFSRSFGDPNEQQVIETRHGRSDDGVTFATNYRALIQRNVIGQATEVVQGRALDGTGGWTRSYGYDNHFYLTSQTDPEVGTTVFGRDLLGNMTSKKIGTQPEVTYGIDSRNRVSSVTYAASEDPLVPQAPNVVNTYLNTDVLSSVTSGGIVRSFTYDDADKITAETLVIDGAQSYSASYGYNANEAMSTMTYPSGNVVSFNPDGFGRARAAAPYVTAVDYHANGMPQQIVYANGVASSMALNSRLWPSSLDVSRNGPNIVQNAYSYDLVGNLREVVDGVDSRYNRTYGYDYVNRLTNEGNSKGVFAYNYDNVGNITAVGERFFFNGSFVYFTLKAYGYDGSSSAPTGTGRLLNFDYGTTLTRFYSYDSAGNVTADGLGMTYGYDRANNMRCSGCAGSAPVFHEYDGANMRVKTTAGGATSYSFYDHRGLLLQVEKPGIERKEYVYLGRRQVAERKVPLN